VNIDLVSLTGGPKKPSAGVRLLELGQTAVGQFAGFQLAYLGADVVKVERPDGGNGMRPWPPLMRGPGGIKIRTVRCPILVYDCELKMHRGSHSLAQYNAEFVAEWGESQSVSIRVHKNGY
jgi:crotonobetainyl-CoA:carnitine CoA-transferase CaiB-like acyl-CoA transferase